MRTLNIKEIKQVSGGNFLIRFLRHVVITNPGAGGPDRYTGGFHG